MYTYLKFGLPRVMPMGLDEVYLNTNFVLWTMTFLAFCFAGCYSVIETIRFSRATQEYHLLQSPMMQLLCQCRTEFVGEG